MQEAILNQKEFFMNIAYKEGQKAFKKGEVPIGAVVVGKNGKILAKAHNKRIKANDATAHAEVLAIRKAGRKVKDFRLNETTMFVTLEPCPMCAGAVVNARIKTLVFGASSDRLEGEIAKSIYSSKLLNHNVEVVGGVLEEKCSCLVKDFFKKRRSETK